MLKEAMLKLLSRKLLAGGAASIAVPYMAVSGVDIKVIALYIGFMTTLVTGQSVLDGMKKRNGD